MELIPVFTEAARVLKDGGKLLIIDLVSPEGGRKKYTKPSYVPYRLSELVESLTTNGFVVYKIRAFLRKGFIHIH
jgi:ubiquinone/menaquinone biosynthesis C-methylase UbiE